jgi:hypothetical protein
MSEDGVGHGRPAARLTPQVFAWMRCASAVIEVAEHILQIPLFCYIDDVFAVTHQRFQEEVAKMLGEIIEGLGFKLAPGKSDQGQCLTILGLQYDLSGDTTVISPPPGKREVLVQKLSDLLQEVDRSDKVALKSLQSIAGQINFLMLHCRFSAARAALTPIYSLFPSVGSEGQIMVNGEAKGMLKAALNNLRNLMGEFQPFVIKNTWGRGEDAEGQKGNRPTMGSKVSILTDAAAEVEGEDTLAGLGWIVKKGKKCWTCRVQVRVKNFTKKCIHLFEMCAVVMAVKQMGQILGNERVTVHVDNSACVFALLKGTSKQKELRMLTQEVQRLMARHGALWVVRYIKSALNVADGMTRTDEQFDRAQKALKDAGLDETEHTMSAHAVWEVLKIAFGDEQVEVLEETWEEM